MRKYANSLPPRVQLCVLVAICAYTPRIEFTLVAGAVAVSGTCGDGHVNGLENCDDGNRFNDDGCSAVCSLETGYMCDSSVRQHDRVNEIGNIVKWTRDNSSTSNVATTNPLTLTVLATKESCARDNIFRHEIWQADLWAALYNIGEHNATNVNTIIPPRGYYCSRFCKETFPAPPGYEFKTGCYPTPKPRCVRGWTDCDSNAYCLDTQSGSGYTCRCDANFFVSGASGTKCDRSGIELIFNLTVAGRDTPQNDMRHSVTNARDVLIQHLFFLGYIKSTVSTPSLIVEGVLDYPVELINAATSQGEALWRVILRIPRDHANTTKFETAGLFNEHAILSALFESREIAVQEAYRCSQHRQRACSHDIDCVGERVDDGKCIRVPDVSVRFLSAGGSTSPLSVTATGFGSSVMSVDYDVSYAAFRVRIRSSHTLSVVCACVVICVCT